LVLADHADGAGHRQHAATTASKHQRGSMGSSRSAMPQQMLAGMGGAWPQRQAFKKHIDELTADS
jgi:hypothetical protein